MGIRLEGKLIYPYINKKRSRHKDQVIGAKVFSEGNGVDEIEGNPSG